MTADLATALQAARLEANVTQAQLARLIGVHVNAIARWENGRGRPTKRLRPGVIQAFTTLRPELGKRVATALAKAFPPKPRWGMIAPVVEAPEPEEPLYSAETWVESGIFRMADHLDVSPRRAREGARKLLKLLAEGDVSVEQALAALGEAEGESTESE